MMVHDIEGGLGIDEADRTYCSSSKSTYLETGKKEGAGDSAAKTDQKKGILKKPNTSPVAKNPNPNQISEEEEERIKIAQDAPKIMETMTLEEYEEAIKV